jgi:2-isopropylmalate synthase
LHPVVRASAAAVCGRAGVYRIFRLAPGCNQKGIAVRENTALWQVPYLPLDPADIGRTYEEVVRVNSQSGKGGVAFILERDYNVRLPRKLQIEFSRVIQRISDETSREIRPAEIWSAFQAEYLNQLSPFSSIRCSEILSEESTHISATVKADGVEHAIDGNGNGPIDAFVDAMNREFGFAIKVVDYEEQSISDGASGTAMAYIGLQFAESESVFGVGMNPSIVKASLYAILCAVNRALSLGKISL